MCVCVNLHRFHINKESVKCNGAVTATAAGRWVPIKTKKKKHWSGVASFFSSSVFVGLFPSLFVLPFELAATEAEAAWPRPHLLTCLHIFSAFRLCLSLPCCRCRCLCTVFSLTLSLAHWCLRFAFVYKLWCAWPVVVVLVFTVVVVLSFYGPLRLLPLLLLLPLLRRAFHSPCFCCCFIRYKYRF